MSGDNPINGDGEIQLDAPVITEPDGEFQDLLVMVKHQLNIWNTGHEDRLLLQKIGVAKMWIASFTGAPFDEAHPLMVEALLQLVAYWYEQREAASFGVTTNPAPFGVYELLRGVKEQVTGHVAP